MKLLVTDLDGTLIKNGSISELNIMALAAWKAQGNKIAIATGRPLVATSHLKQVINYDYAITANGSLITDHLGKVILKKIIDIDIIKEIVNLIDVDNYHCFLSDGYQIVSIKDYQKNPINDILFISITPKSKKVKDIKPLYNILNKRYFKSASFVCNKYHLDVGAVNCTKGIAIGKIVKNYNISNQEVLVFGDQDNDISMFEAYENSFYVYGGSKNLRKIAKNKIKAVSDVIEFKHAFDVQ